MKKIIKVDTNLNVTIHDFPEGNYTHQNKILCELIGYNCDTLEHVRPFGLYDRLSFSREPGANCVSMLVDENFLSKNLPHNLYGSWLYGTYDHGYPILGNILLIGEEYNNDGIDFCGIEEAAIERLKNDISLFKNQIGWSDRGAHEEDD